jgi:hypothetical protein
LGFETAKHQQASTSIAEIRYDRKVLEGSTHGRDLVEVFKIKLDSRAET